MVLIHKIAKRRVTSFVRTKCFKYDLNVNVQRMRDDGSDRFHTRIAISSGFYSRRCPGRFRLAMKKPSSRMRKKLCMICKKLGVGRLEWKDKL